MSDKAALIKEMLEMQAQFTADEQAGKFNAEDYYIGEGKAYRAKYQELSDKVREAANKEANFWK